jgi:preprotein translocase subunit SecD
MTLRWKLILILVVLVGFAAVGVYPLVAAHYGVHSPSALMDKQLKLGLDLKGGVHLVLRVQTDDALRLETEQEMERLRADLMTKGIVVSNITTQQGANGDEIPVQLPGVTDVERAKEIIRSTGLLELKIVEQGPSATREGLLVNGQEPAGMEIIPGSSGTPGDTANTVYYLVRKVAAVTGKDLRNARPTIDENNQPAVSFTLNSDGGRRFGNVTGENIGRQLAIVLDGRVQSAPRIDGRITTDGRITGSFTTDEVNNLSLILRSGALPATLTYLQEQTIGPSLGADSIRSGVTASIVGLLLVISFMLVYYRLSGVNAVIALTLNLIILLGLMAYIGAVMTLPGIAGFVLTMGIVSKTLFELELDRRQQVATLSI